VAVLESSEKYWNPTQVFKFLTDQSSVKIDSNNLQIRKSQILVTDPELIVDSKKVFFYDVKLSIYGNI